QAHNNKKCIGTLSSSQTTPAHPTTTTYKVTAVKAAEPETTTQRKPKSNPSSTTVYLAQQPHEINSFPLASPSRPLEATDEDITTNSQTTQIRSTA
ncbi:hypothetical protein QP172_11485, partial [Corynebacterium coyleae]